MKLRIIGDVHGKFDAYKRLLNDCDYSIQLGDFGFEHAWRNLSRHKIDSTRHKIIPGNHDEYPKIDRRYTFGTDYGRNNTWIDGFNFFWIRGAYSVDKHMRTENINWWKEEEISYKEFELAVDLFSKDRPDIVFAHDIPSSIYNNLFYGVSQVNRTSNYLNLMYFNHRPKLWFFGHHHKSLMKKIDGTNFICINELDFVDYHINKNIEWNINNIKKQMNVLSKKYKSLRY